jgi:hypothetical protein
LWHLTTEVLAEYNRQTGSKLRAMTSAGKPSEASKRIYMRIKDYPDITFDEFADIIERTLASRWWGKDSAPTIGVVFGPNVFEDNITRKPGGKNDKQGRDKKRLAAMARLMGQEEE